MAAQTKHIRLYVEMDVAPAREREMLDLFHRPFVPEAVKHEGSVPPAHNYRFELEFARVWPPVEMMMTFGGCNRTLRRFPVPSL